MPKINALPPQTAPDGSDVFPTDDVSDSNKTKKLTLTALKEWFQSLAGWITTVMIGDLQITAGKLASNAVETAKVKDANITGVKIAVGRCFYDTTSAGGSSTTSSTYVDVPNASASITTTGGPLLLMISLPLYVSIRTASGGIQINGVTYDMLYTDATAPVGSHVGFYQLAAGVVPAGTYTVKARYHAQNAGDTAYISSYDTVSFSVIEI